MQSYRKAVALAAFAWCPHLAYATTGYRNAYVTELQSGSDSARLTYIQQTGPWLGSPNCPADFSYFSATDNPHLLAIALAARMAGKNVRVYVDDTLPKSSGGHCKITYLSVLPD
jgi:hypothetical protein